MKKKKTLNTTLVQLQQLLPISASHARRRQRMLKFLLTVLLSSRQKNRKLGKKSKRRRRKLKTSLKCVSVINKQTPIRPRHSIWKTKLFNSSKRQIWSEDRIALPTYKWTRKPYKDRRRRRRCVSSVNGHSMRRWSSFKRILKRCITNRWRIWFDLRKPTACKCASKKRLWNVKLNEWSLLYELSPKTLADKKLRGKWPNLKRRKLSGSKNCSTLTNCNPLRAASTKSHSPMTQSNFSRWASRRRLLASAEHW